MLVGLCVFFLTFLTLGHGASVLDDVCHLMTVSDLNSNSPADALLDIPKGCGSGDVDWHYPKGNLRLSVSLPNTKDYTFCIEESWATMIGGVTDVTAGRHKTLSLPTKENPTCVKSAGDKVELLLTSEDTQYYMTTFKYAIKP